MVHTCGAFWWSVSEAREGRLHGQPWPAYSDQAGGGPSCLPWRHDIGDGNEVTDKSAEANPTDLVGVRLDNKYEVISEVARGGMGIVYRGIDQSLGRPVAIKVLFKRYNEDTESIERFKREARAMATLDHTNICPVYAIGHEHGVHYFVMKFLSGWTVSERLKRNRLGLADMFSVEEVRDVLIQLCLGLDHAHQLGLIHRDIKPGNIMIAPDGHTSIMDFGIVKESDDDTLTKTGIVFGTPDYMAPEHAQGQAPSPETDLYSLGIVAYEMLTGEQPFKGGTPFSLVLKHIKEPPPPLIERRDDLDQAFQDIIFKSIEKKPEDRYHSARDMADALKALTLASAPGVSQVSAAEQPVSVAPQTPPPPPPRTSNTMTSPPLIDEPVIRPASEAPDVVNEVSSKSGLPTNRPSIFTRETESGQRTSLVSSTKAESAPPPQAIIESAPTAASPGHYRRIEREQAAAVVPDRRTFKIFLGTVLVTSLIGVAVLLYLNHSSG